MHQISLCHISWHSLTARYMHGNIQQRVVSRHGVVRHPDSCTRLIFTVIGNAAVRWHELIHSSGTLSMAMTGWDSSMSIIIGGRPMYFERMHYVMKVSRYRTKCFVNKLRQLNSRTKPVSVHIHRNRSSELWVLIDRRNQWQPSWLYTVDWK